MAAGAGSVSDCMFVVGGSTPCALTLSSTSEVGKIQRQVRDDSFFKRTGVGETNSASYAKRDMQAMA